MKYVLIFILLSLMLATPAQVRANDIHLQLSPPLMQINALPPAEIDTPLTIENTSNEGVNLKIAFNLFKDSGRETGELTYLSDKDPFPGPDPKLFEKVHLIDEHTVAIDSLAVGPKQKKKLRLRISLPKNEPAADYYFSIVFLTTPSTPIPNDAADAKKVSAASRIEAGIAANVLLSVGAKEDNQTFITEFSSPFYLNSGPVPFTVKLSNNGRHVSTPKGLILIKNMFGQTVGRIELPPANILAGSTRGLIDAQQLANESAAKESLLEMQNRPLAQAPHALWTEKFLLGLYTATLTLGISDDGPVFTRSIYFIAFPIKLLFEILVAIVIMIVIYVRVKARMAKE